MNREALIEAYKTAVNAYLEELKEAYIKGGLKALNNAYRTDYGIGYTLDGGKVSFITMTPKEQTNNKRFWGSFIDNVLNDLTDIEQRKDFTSTRKNREAVLSNEVWHLEDFTTYTAEELISDDLTYMEAYLNLPRINKQQWEAVSKLFDKVNAEKDDDSSREYPDYPLSAILQGGFMGEEGSLFTETYEEATLVSFQITIWANRDNGGDANLLRDTLKEAGITPPTSFNYDGDGNGVLLFGFDFIPA